MNKSDGIKKFLALEENKRDRIVNAAMKEFSYGYKRASTDTIVKDAAISKGLLFHYFGTKENLFEFLINYAADILEKDFYDMINLGQKDIIESVWQQALLKRDISDKYPHIHTFFVSLQAEYSVQFAKKYEEIVEVSFKQCDKTLFREDVDPKKIFDIIVWGTNGFFEANEHKANEYATFLDALRSYLDIFRLIFYKPGTEDQDVKSS